MLNLPEPPRTRISRQLTCVSCHEQFTIAEDDPIRKESPSENWQMPNDSYPDVQLRYEPDRSQRPVTPESFAIPGQEAGSYWSRDNDLYQINCPRCGADNRNWLHILNPPLDHAQKELTQKYKWLQEPILWKGLFFADFAIIIALLFGVRTTSGVAWFEEIVTAVIFLALLLPFLFSPVSITVKARHWGQKYGLAAAGMMITIGFMFMAGYFYFHWDSERIIRSITLLLVIGLAGIITTTRMLAAWLAQREYGYFTNVVSPTSLSQKISPPLKVWLNFTALYLIIIPLLFYVIFPSGFYWLTTLGEPAPPEPAITLEQRINNILGELEIVLIQAPPGTIEPAAEAIDDLVAFLAGVPMPVDALDNLTLDQRAAIVLSWTNDLLKNASEEDKEFIRNAVNNLEAFIATANLDTAVSATTPTPDTTPAEQPPWQKLDKDFFNAWFKYVLAASIASLVFSMAAVNGYVHRINQHLPPPIYHSLANMTRVVVWEAKRALEIGDEVQQMQWTAVQRNNLGGIDLLGLYRDNQPLDSKKDLLTTKILAQHYKIKSDKWGKIVEAEIKPIRVSPQPGRFQLKEAEFPLGDQLFSAAATRAAGRQQSSPRHS